MANNLESKIESIRFTEKAALKALEFAKAEKSEGMPLRIKVEDGGCAGLQYVMHFDDKKSDKDKELEFYGLKVYVDQFSLHYIEGTEIDYVERLAESGFKFNNPNIKTRCGCGHSFTDE